MVTYTLLSFLFVAIVSGCGFNHKKWAYMKPSELVLKCETYEQNCASVELKFTIFAK